MNNPVPKYEIDQEVWFGGIEKQFNGYITSIELKTSTLGLQVYPLILYSINVSGFTDKHIINKEEIYLYNTREELIKSINSQAKELGIQLSAFRKETK
jgi:hypothetical protein